MREVTMSLDRETIRLREHHDFGFLRNLGEVFCAFDEQDSGNICFGVDAGAEKLFVKYAGAQTINSHLSPEDAARALEKAMPVYEYLRHPALVDLRKGFSVGGGYAAVFAWFPGECLHPHWAFAGDRKHTHPDSPFRRFRELPLEMRLDSLDTIFAFHEHVAAKGYVAIDFYDGSVLYDFSTNATKICDVDLYGRLPQTNTMGRMYGSSRFMSPEEFELGATIDEVTNVFTMGAAAFVFLGGEKDRSPEKWQAGRALHEVALKAVSPERNARHQSIKAFRAAWDKARTKG